MIYSFVLWSAIEQEPRAGKEKPKTHCHWAISSLTLCQDETALRTPGDVIRLGNSRLSSNSVLGSPREIF